ncbi:MAG: Fic family protein [Lewinellaceae bacterium]|nr:Fic family protein [Lewinellaceae bacterium]
MENLLSAIDAKKGELAQLEPFRPEDAERLWKKFRLEWNYNSNHIEGNTLTYPETELILIFDQSPGGSHSVREIEEMKAHDVAVALVRDWAADEKRELTETDIRDLNRILLVRPFWKEALTADGQPTRRLISIGEYKKYPNSVRLPNGEMFHYASPDETPRKMQELITWYRDASQRLHPVIVAARLHYEFVRIHPFDDGNGRGARLLMNYHLFRHSFPPVIIKSVDKKGYFAALQRADVGDFEAFVTYIAEQLTWSLDLSIRAGNGESVEEQGDWEKQVTLLKREAEAKNPQARSDKTTLKNTLSHWLKINFPIIYWEFIERFEPFDQFFATADCSSYFKYKNSGVAVSVLPEDDNWVKIAQEVVDGGYEPKLIFRYYFKGFLYSDKNSPISFDPPTIFIEFIGDSAILNEHKWSIYSTLPISHKDLQPIRDLAQMFYKQIQVAIGKS